MSCLNKMEELEIEYDKASQYFNNVREALKNPKISVKQANFLICKSLERLLLSMMKINNQQEIFWIRFRCRVVLKDSNVNLVV